MLLLIVSHHRARPSGILRLLILIRYTCPLELPPSIYTGLFNTLYFRALAPALPETSLI